MYQSSHHAWNLETDRYPCHSTVVVVFSNMSARVSYNSDSLNDLDLQLLLVRIQEWEHCWSSGIATCIFPSSWERLYTEGSPLLRHKVLTHLDNLLAMPYRLSYVSYIIVLAALWHHHLFQLKQPIRCIPYNEHHETFVAGNISGFCGFACYHETFIPSHAPATLHSFLAITFVHGIPVCMCVSDYLCVHLWDY